MTLFEELSWRGFVNQVTHPDLGERLEKETFTLYCGFDPTADSLHIGHLTGLMALMHFQRYGHRPIALVGGATGMIGDPSFKSDERQLLTPEQIGANVAGVRGQIQSLLGDAIVVNNADWLGEFKLIEFLRDIGKHFSVNVMISRDSVRRRLEDRDHGISFTEFTYMLLQASDFLHLFDEYGCRLQIGGSDQWGNIVPGMDLTRRLREGATTYGLTFPLLTKADGTKFGKTEEGAVWLDPKRTSPYKFYQFWVNQADNDTSRLLRTFTLLPQEEIELLEQAIQDAPERREAQKVLAAEVTRMVHGEEALQGALAASQAMFGGDLSSLDAATLEDVFSDVPSAERPRSELEGGRPLLDVLVESGVFASKGEARRMVKNGGLYLNNAQVQDENAMLSQESLAAGDIAVVRKGKRNYHLLKFRG